MPSMSSHKRRLPVFLSHSASTSSSSTSSNSPAAASDHQLLQAAAGRQQIDLTGDNAASSFSSSSPSPSHCSSSTSSCPSSSSSTSSPRCELLQLTRDLLLEISGCFSLFEMQLYRSVCKLFASFTTTQPTVYRVYTSLSLHPSSFAHPLTTSAFSSYHSQQEKCINVWPPAHTARAMELLSTHPFPSVCTLRLGKVDLTPALLQLLLRKCGQVRSVFMDSCDRERGQLLHALLQAFPQLEELHLDGVFFKNAEGWTALRRLRLTAFSYYRQMIGPDSEMGCGQAVEAVLAGSSQSLRSLQLEQFVWHAGGLLLTDALSSELPLLSHLNMDCSVSSPLFTEQAALLADRQKDEQKKKKRRKSTASGACGSAVQPVVAAAAAAATLPAQPAALPSFPQLRSLSLQSCRHLSAADVIGIGLFCPRLESVDLSDNQELRTNSLRILLSQQHFPRLTELRVNNWLAHTLPALLTSLAASPGALEPNSSLRLFHCNGLYYRDVQGELTAGMLQTLSRILPCLRSLSLSHRGRMESAPLSSLLASLPLLSSLFLLRMKLVSLPELESLCLQYGPGQQRRLRHVHVSITGVLHNLHALRKELSLAARQLLLSGARGDKARRLWAHQQMERVWLDTGCGVTLHIDTENVY